MNQFSDNEYQNLRADTAEVRSCITRYIGYIISVTGAAGFIKFYFSEELGSMGTITFLMISLIVLTFLFEIIWYKFKSHNRFVGYMQLLMQEVGAIPYRVIDDKKYWVDKKYISKYDEFKISPEDKGLNILYSWEFVMSRLNGNYFAKNLNDDMENARYSEAIGKSKFVFSIPFELYPYINVEDRDVEFFKNIIIPLYRKENSLPLITNFHHYWMFAFNMNKSKPLDTINVEKRYLVYGWEFPRKITQIAFSAFSLIYFFLLYYLVQNFDFINPFNAFGEIDGYEKIRQPLKLSLPFLIFLASTALFILFWWKRYIKGLKELIYGKFSIDYYCWKFFLFRVQILNNKKLVPIIFSRAFVRFFKSKLYHQLMKKNELALKEIFGDAFDTDLVTEYKSKLVAFEDFEGRSNIIELHKALKNSFKKMPLDKKKKGKLLIPEDILREEFASVF